MLGLVCAHAQIPESRSLNSDPRPASFAAQRSIDVRSVNPAGGTPQPDLKAQCRAGRPLCHNPGHPARAPSHDKRSRAHIQARRASGAKGARRVRRPSERPERSENQPRERERQRKIKVARETGLEPAASAVTGRRSNQLSYSRNNRSAGGKPPARVTRHRIRFRRSQVKRSRSALPEGSRRLMGCPAPGWRRLLTVV